jgi:hypothetical protein
MIIVRLLSTRAFMVGFGTTKFTRAWEPALLWNQLHVLTARYVPASFSVFHTIEGGLTCKVFARLKIVRSEGLFSLSSCPM